jgi:hypothetical protein
MTEIGGIIAIDDAHVPAVRTVLSFVANNLPYKIHFPTPRLALCTKTAMSDHEWCHFKPIQSSPRSDWNMHDEWPDKDAIPGGRSVAMFGTHSPDPRKPGITDNIRRVAGRACGNRAELDAIRNATFWRMTAPLRAMIDWARRFTA